MDPYRLIIAGKYKHAVRAFSRELERSPDPRGYNGRAEAYLLLGDYDRALADFAVAGYFDYAQKMITRSDYSFTHVAACLWLKRNYDEAAAVWAYTVEEMYRGRFAYSDLAGGVECGCFLWFASARLARPELREAAEDLFDKKLRKRGDRFWPAHIAIYLRGQSTAEELRQVAIQSESLRDRHLCQAEFYIGARAMAEGHTDRALTAFTAAASLKDAHIQIEYYLADHEAKILGAPN